MFIHFHSNGVRFWSSAMASPFVTTTCRFWSGAMSSRNMSSSDSRSNNSSSSSKSWRDVDLDGSVEIQPLWFPPKKHVGEEKLSEANKLRWFCSWTRCGRTNRLANDRLLSWLVAASCGSQKWRTSFFWLKTRLHTCINIRRVESSWSAKFRSHKHWLPHESDWISNHH